MKTIYQNAWNHSYTYEDYLKLVDQKIDNKLSTGHEQNEMLADFTKLNRARMKRLDKTQQILPELEKAVKAIRVPQIWLVLTESWCGDAAQHLPVFNKLSALNPLIELRLVLRDDNDELMQKYLTKGGRSIPKLIVVSDDMETTLFDWGPRPKVAQVEVERLLHEQGGFNDAVKEGIQVWYNKDEGRSLQEELMKLMK